MRRTIHAAAPDGTEWRLHDKPVGNGSTQIVVRRRFSEATSNVHGDAFACTLHRGHGALVPPNVAVKVVPLDDSDEYMLQRRRGGYDVYSRTALRTAEWTERLVLELCAELLEQHCSVGLPYLVAWHTAPMPVSAWQAQPVHAIILPSDSYESDSDGDDVYDEASGSATDDGQDEASSDSHQWFRRQRRRRRRRHQRSSDDESNDTSETDSSSSSSSSSATTIEASADAEAEPDGHSCRSWTDVPGMFERRSRALLLFSEIAGAGTLHAYAKKHARRRRRSKVWSHLALRRNRGARTAAPWHAIIMHTMCALYALQKYCNVTHHDLHLENVLLVPLRTYARLNANVDYWWSYRIDGRHYYVPARATDVVPILWDFGAAFAPGHIPNNDFEHGTATGCDATDALLRSSADYMALLELLEEMHLMSDEQWQPYAELLQPTAGESDDDTSDSSESPFAMYGYSVPLRDAIPHLFAERYAAPPPDLARARWLGRLDLDQRLALNRPALQRFFVPDVLATVVQ